LKALKFLTAPIAGQLFLKLSAQAVEIQTLAKQSGGQMQFMECELNLKTMWGCNDVCSFS